MAVGKSLRVSEPTNENRQEEKSKRHDTSRPVAPPVAGQLQTLPTRSVSRSDCVAAWSSGNATLDSCSDMSEALQTGGTQIDLKAAEAVEAALTHCCPLTVCTSACSCTHTHTQTLPISLT